MNTDNLDGGASSKVCGMLRVSKYMPSIIQSFETIFSIMEVDEETKVTVLRRLDSFRKFGEDTNEKWSNEETNLISSDLPNDIFPDPQFNCIEMQNVNVNETYQVDSSMIDLFPLI